LLKINCFKKIIANEEKKMKKNDFIIIAIVILLAIGGIFYLNVLKSQSGRIARISVNEKIFREIDLNTIKAGESIEFDVANGHGHVVASAEGIIMAHSDCRDQICVKTGLISNQGEMIVCLPNKIVIEILGNTDSDDGVDVISQ
jgi:hypothetical protein